VQDSDGISFEVDQNFKDTWHGSIGAQYRIADAWLWSIGFAYDSSPLDDKDRTPDFPTAHTFRNDVLAGELKPQLAPGKNYFDSFLYEFTNVSDTDLQIDWQNTLYLQNGKEFGRWGMDDLTIEELSEKKELPIVTVAPGNTLSGLIFPLRLIAMSTLAQKTGDKPVISRGIIPEGESGMLLTVRQDGREIQEEMKFKIAITQ
jgi:hypothetical protein